MKIVIFVFLHLFLFGSIPAFAKIFNKCSLAKELLKFGIPKSELEDWICIADHESSFDTSAIKQIYGYGHFNWGLFQFNDELWCMPPNGMDSLNLCEIPCNSVITDNIHEAVKCARYIQNLMGFAAWVEWRKHCTTLKPIIADCFSGSKKLKQHMQNFILQNTGLLKNDEEIIANITELFIKKQNATI